MERTKRALVEFVNYEIGTTLERWKNDSNSIEEIAKLNELFRLSEKMELNMTLEVYKEAIDRKAGDDFIRILHAEVEIYGEEKENSWFFKVKPGSGTDRDSHILYASSLGEKPMLVFYHQNHGADGHFRPSDIISIAIH
jgi:hypothetical protein